MALRPHHIAFGAALFGAAVYGSYSYTKTQQEACRLAEQAAAGDQGSPDSCCHGCAFDRLAGVYDDIVGKEESGMGMGWLRWWLLRKAQGDVLELSTGTGRNLPYFPYSSITSVTLTDVSAKMLQQAQRKYFDELQLQYKQPDVDCKFQLADAQHMVTVAGQQPHTVLLPVPKRTSQHSSSSSSGGGGGGGGGSLLRRPLSSSSSSSSSRGGSSGATGSHGSSNDAMTDFGSSLGGPSAASPSSSSSSSGASASQPSSSSSSSGSSTFAPHSFDTVVDTFGLCSCENPVEVLKQAAQLLKPGGKLLLLEHGQGTWDFINGILDRNVQNHYNLYGCWYNRDILGIVEDAGLNVGSVSRWHFGTTYLIVASAPEQQQQQTAAKVVSAA